MSHSDGRRLDVIVSPEQDENRDIELCLLKFKKSDATYATVLQQQSKNLRTNACILNDIHLLTHNEGACIAYIDFCGRAGYIAQLFKTKEKCVALEVAEIVMIKSLLVEIDILRQTTLDFYRWKSTIIKSK